MGFQTYNHLATTAHGDDAILPSSDDFEDGFAAFMRSVAKRGNYYRLAPTILDRGFAPIPFDYEWNPNEGKNRKYTKYPWKQFQSKSMTKDQLQKTISKFGAAPMVAIPTGKHSGITVVDIDGDAADIDFAIETFGETAVMVQTPSFGVHLYYRHNEEKNPVRILNRPIDIRGQGGCIIVPGSYLDGEFYQFIAGGWDDFDVLEPAKFTISENKSRQAKAIKPRQILEGRRDDALYNHGRNIIGTFLPPVSGNDGGQIEKSLERACKKFTKHLLGWNQVKCNPPLADKEVIYKAKNLWKRKLEGSLYEDGRRMISLPDDEKFMGLARTSPGALALLFQLRQRFMPFKEFTAPQSRSKEFGISPKTFGNDMQLLVNNGFLYRRHKGGRFSTSFAIAHKINNGHGDANIYILAMP